MVGKVPANYLRSQSHLGGDQRSSSSEELGLSGDSPDQSTEREDPAFSQRLIQSFNIGDRHRKAEGDEDPPPHGPPQRRHSDLSDHYSLLGNRDDAGDDGLARYRCGTKQTDV